MGKFLYNLRYYSYGHEKYNECMDKLFINNMDSLRQVSRLAAIFTVLFVPFPLFVEKNYITAVMYLASALVSFMLFVYTNFKMQTGGVSNRLVYLLITIFFTNLIFFSIYTGVWATPDKLATIFLCFLICGLLVFINPLLFNFCLIFGAVVALIISTLLVKSPLDSIHDIVNTLFAAILSIFVNWIISKLRIGFELSSSMLEEERNKYHDQSTIDELTKLKNRRDFMHTFQRFLSNYRASDDWLCLAICDIDFFKNYNDHYGHPMGDDCLRAVGKVLNNLTDEMGVYTARVGGEEFALLWFEKEASHVNNVISTLTSMIKDQKILHEKSIISEYVTMSVGVYIERLGEPTDVDSMYELADKALYTAKASGRNCAIVSGREVEQYKITPGS